MNIKTALLTCLLLTACDLSSLKSAIPDLELPKSLKPQACTLYRQRGVELAESIWQHDWPVFAEIWDMPADPVSDEAFCRRVIASRGATFAYKPQGAHSSTAAGFVVLLHPDYDSWPAEKRASTMCHEAAHIVWEHRRKALAVVDYATISGRLVTEATASALGSALLERYGASPAERARELKSRAKRFPEAYKVARTVDSACVEEYFGDVRETLRERAGV